MFLIADVSGKGVPAALFMMTTKTLINYIAQTSMEPKDIIQTINKKICENNKQGFFITLLAGIVNINTGKITFINCGHNPPLVKKNNGDFEYLKLDSNIVLGAFDSAEFNVSESVLNKGDTIFIYTDGITEAVNSSDEQYGETRLLETINTLKTESAKSIIEKIKTNVKEFAQGVAQSDDMTMLAFKYNGKVEKQKEVYTGIVKQENYQQFLSWLTSICNKWSINQEIAEKLHLVSEELYTNIFSYAYETHEGYLEAVLERDETGVTFILKDRGIPYNPLERPDPDVTLPPESRDMGGLGIFIVKNSVDEISYEYKDGFNILTMKLV